MTWLLWAAVLLLLIALASVSVPLRWVVIGSVVLIAVFMVHQSLWLRRIRAERKSESICTFARALPAKAHDRWVVRAVYEEISRQVEAPIRPTDDVAKFWGIDGDDLDDAVIRIARLAGRSAADFRQNPMGDKVVTVADLISFIECQPREPAR